MSGQEEPDSQVNTGGGANIKGNVNTGGGDFVGRDKIVQLPPEPVVPALHQIPAPPPDFTGREKEIAELLDAIQAGGAVISGLQGMGGVGKSALAFVLAQKLKDQYPDAQLFLRCRGASQEPAAPAELMGHIIHAYRADLRLPQDTEELAGLYHTMLDGQKALLLFDDARDPAQLEPLLPLPAGCLALVTSRQHFYLAGLHALSLDALPLPDAISLLLTVAPRIDGRAELLANLCYRLPLALRLTAGALRARLDLEPTGYARRLEDTGARLKLTGVDAALQASYDLLSTESQARWRTLAVFPGSFEALAAAAVWGIEPETAADALGELFVRSLLDFDSTARRYRLHDLARLFAGKLLEQDESARSFENHASYYLEVVWQANSMYLKGTEGVLAGLGLFDREWENVQAGQAWVARHLENGETAVRMCNGYPNAGIYFLELRLNPRQRIAWLEAGLKAARLLEDLAYQGVHLGNLGIVYAALGEPLKAIEYYEQRLGIARQIGDRSGEETALGNLGNAYADLGELRKAIEYYEQDLEIARQVGDRRSEGAVLSNLGIAYINLGEPRKAIEYYEQDLEIARQIGDRRGEGAVLGNLGIVYADLGELRKAIEYYDQDMEIARQIGDRRGEEAVLGNLGVAYVKLREPRKAIEYYEQSLEIARQIGDRRGEGVILGNLGTAYAALGEPLKAIEYYEQDLEIARQIGDRRGIALDSWNLGIAYQSLGDLEKAAACMQVRVDYEKEIGHPDYEKNAQIVAMLRQKLEQEAKNPPAPDANLPASRR